MIEQSETIAKLAGALCKAQEEMRGAHMNAKNPHYRSKFADLTSVINAIKPHLCKEGLSFLQTVGTTESGTPVVTTQLMHNSGEWIRDSLGIKPLKAGPQAVGSAISYARRYSLAAFVGLPQLDDDAERASRREASEPRKKPQGQSQPKERSSTNGKTANDAANQVEGNRGPVVGNVAKCKKCYSQVIWRTANGRSAAVNPDGSFHSGTCAGSRDKYRNEGRPRPRPNDVDKRSQREEARRAPMEAAAVLPDVEQEPEFREEDELDLEDTPGFRMAKVRLGQDGKFHETCGECGRVLTKSDVEKPYCNTCFELRSPDYEQTYMKKALETEENTVQPETYVLTGEDLAVRGPEIGKLAKDCAQWQRRAVAVAKKLKEEGKPVTGWKFAVVKMAFFLTKERLFERYTDMIPTGKECSEWNLPSPPNHSTHNVKELDEAIEKLTTARRKRCAKPTETSCKNCGVDPYVPFENGTFGEDSTICNLCEKEARPAPPPPTSEEIVLEELAKYDESLHVDHLKKWFREIKIEPDFGRVRKASSALKRCNVETIDLLATHLCTK